MAFGDDIRQRTVSDDAVYAKFAGTPLQGYEQSFLSLAQEHNIDPNWALAYLQWESGFGNTPIGRGNPTNPWDILCYPGQWQEVGEYRPGNGFCYAVYPSVPIGLQAGFRLWQQYVNEGHTDWPSTLSRSLCGLWEGCDSSWVGNVIEQGRYNASHWPYTGPTDPGGPTFVEYLPPPPPYQEYQPVYGEPVPGTGGNIIFGVGLALAGLLLLTKRRT